MYDKNFSVESQFSAFNLYLDIAFCNFCFIVITLCTVLHAVVLS